MRDTAIDAWWTTQETSFALLAIGQLAQRQGKMAPYGGKVYAGKFVGGPSEWTPRPTPTSMYWSGAPSARTST